MNNTINKLKKDDISFNSSVDGLWDIGLGLSFLLAWFSFTQNIVAYVAIFYFIIFLMIKKLKSMFTYPRIGFVNHSGMKLTVKKFLILLNVLGVIFLGLGIFVYLNITKGSFVEETTFTVQNVAPLIIGFIVSVLVFLTAIVFGIKRFHFYGALIFGSFIVVKFVGWELPLALLFCGTVILIIGLLTFITFIRKYPKLEEVDMNE